METFDQEGEYATIVRKGNIGRRQNAGISINAQITAGKWLTSNVYANYNYNKFSGTLNGEKLEVEGGTMIFNVNNQVRFNIVWSAEFSGWYRTRGIEGQIALQPMGQLSAGVSRQVIERKGICEIECPGYILHPGWLKGRNEFQVDRSKFYKHAGYESGKSQFHLQIWESR